MIENRRYISTILIRIIPWAPILRESEGLDNVIEVWLHFLDYFLKTPHQDLVNRAHHFQHNVNFNTMFRNVFGLCWPSNVTAEDFIANDYNRLASHCHLGVVEAADCAEFVMSNNSFCLWEGKMDGLPDAHRLFIVSPRVPSVQLDR